MYFCSATQKARKPISIKNSVIASPPDALYRICRKMYIAETAMREAGGKKGGCMPILSCG
jgi:hypothetical protein